MIPTLTDAALAIRERSLSSVDLVERCLKKTDAHNGALRAWVEVDAEAALETARQCDDEAHHGNFRGPLHGVPIGVKDIIDVAGFPTRAGSPLRENGPPAETDAPVVAALRRAGAIVLGKTVTVEFACFDPSPSRNPWNAAHTPGGSSSGSAVAVATGMVPAALGTQTGGSLVRPSAFCGIATCKPTFGQVCREGIVPVSYHFDHVGPMARCVADLRTLLELMPTDWVFHPPECEAIPSETTTSAAFERPPQIGLLQSYFLDIASPDVRRATLNAVERLRDAGATVKPFDLSPDDGPGLDFARILPMHRKIMSVEVAAYHQKSFEKNPDAYGPLIGRLIEEGLRCRATEFEAALQSLRTYRRRMATLVDRFDLILVPSAHTTAPASLETTGTPEFQAPFSCAGLPLVSLPCAIGSDGLPISIQLVGRYHNDRRVLEWAQWVEGCLGFEAVPEGY